MGKARVEEAGETGEGAYEKFGECGELKELGEIEEVGEVGEAGERGALGEAAELGGGGVVVLSAGLLINPTKIDKNQPLVANKQPSNAC